jgi:hypothetical protein
VAFRSRIASANSRSHGRTCRTVSAPPAFTPQQSAQNAPPGTYSAPAGINLTLNGPVTLAAPGGVTQVDAGEFKDFKLLNHTGAIAVGSCALKEEAFLLHGAFTGAKTGGAVLKAPNLGISIKAIAAKDGKGGLDLECEGILGELCSAKMQN